MRHLTCVILLSVAMPAFAQPAPQQPSIAARNTAASYVRAAASADAYEIQSSQAVLARAANPDVRRFAEMMITDHGRTTADIKAAAKTASVGAAPGLGPRQASMLKQLRAMPKNKMERGYVDQQVVAHQEALTLHQGYAQQGDNPGLRQVASTAVPVVEAHLAEIRRIQSSMGGAMSR